MHTAASDTLSKGFAVSTALYSKVKQSDDRDMIILWREGERDGGVQTITIIRARGLRRTCCC
jgi:hypothetical protein